MRKPWAVSLAICCATLASGNAAAYDEAYTMRQQGAPAILADLLLLRPFGIGITVAGTALFLATSPFTAIAAIAPPHDALQKAGTALSVAPAAFTFMRPLGEWTYQPCGVYSAVPDPCRSAPPISAEYPRKAYPAIGTAASPGNRNATTRSPGR